MNKLELIKAYKKAIDENYTEINTQEIEYNKSLFYGNKAYISARLKRCYIENEMSRKFLYELENLED